MGILSHIKHLGPLILYVTCILFSLRGLTGDGRWALLLAAFLVPLRNIIDKLQEFPLGNQLIDILIAAALIGAFFYSSKEKRQFLVPSISNLIIVVLVIYTFLSFLLGNNYLDGTFSFSLSDYRLKDWKNFCLMPLLFFITLNHITNRAWVVRMLMAMACAIILIEYYTVAQIHEHSSLLSRERITGTFQFLGPNEVAAFFNQYTVVLISIFFFIKNKWAKWALLAIIGANIYCILFLYSRGAYLGLLAGMLFLFAFKNKKMFIVLILLVLFGQAIFPEKVIERIKHTENEYGQLDESSADRLLIWHQGMELFQKSPLVGIGFDVFRYLGLMLGDTHNIYVKILAEQGLVGMLIFLIVIFCFLRMGYVLYKKGEDDLSKGMGLGLMACIIVMMINNFFGDRWTYFELSAYLWILAGLVGRLIIMAQSPEALAQAEQKTKNAPAAIAQKKKKLRYYDL